MVNEDNATVYAYTLIRAEALRKVMMRVQIFHTQQIHFTAFSQQTAWSYFVLLHLWGDREGKKLFSQIRANG